MTYDAQVRAARDLIHMTDPYSKERAEDAERLVWAFSRNRIEYSADTPSDDLCWMYDNTASIHEPLLALGEGPVPILTDEAREAIDKARGGNLHG